jgi:hypothetical protein
MTNRQLNWYDEKYCVPCTDHNLTESVLILTPDEIIIKVCNLLGVAVGKTLGTDRHNNYVVARYIISDILYSDKILTMSLKQIGRVLGNRHHTTIINCIRNIENRCQVDKDFRDKYRQVHIDLYGSDLYFRYNEKYFTYLKLKKRKKVFLVRE